MPINIDYQKQNFRIVLPAILLKIFINVTKLSFFIGKNFRFRIFKFFLYRVTNCLMGIFQTINEIIFAIIFRSPTIFISTFSIQTDLCNRTKLTYICQSPYISSSQPQIRRRAIVKCLTNVCGRRLTLSIPMMMATTTLQPFLLCTLLLVLQLTKSHSS